MINSQGDACIQEDRLIAMQWPGDDHLDLLLKLCRPPPLGDDHSGHLPDQAAFSVAKPKSSSAIAFAVAISARQYPQRESAQCSSPLPSPEVFK